MDILDKYTVWNWARFRRHLVYWLAWSLFFITINALMGQQYTIWQWTAFEAAVLPVKISCAYLIAYGLMPHYLYQRRYRQFLLIVFTVVCFFAFILYSVYVGFIHPFILQSGKEYYLNEFVFKGVELVYIAGLIMSIKFFQNYLHEQARNQELSQQKLEAELKYLKNQIQPHFLFNTLNNIYSMVLANDKNAAAYVVQLSDLLQYILYESETPRISLVREVEILEGFIELERLRYNRTLDFTYRSSKIDKSLQIAPLLLVPFIENAFKHGPAQEEGSSFIIVELEVQQKILFFSVWNSFPQKVESTKIQSGIGLENIKKRLKLLYPDRHTISIKKTNTFEVELIIELD